MRPIHIFLAILVAAAWGTNFIAVKLGLDEIPPLLLCTLRFFFASIPIVFFVPKPKVSFKQLFCYSFFAFTLQFSLLFLGLKHNMPAGLSSILLQIQVFFSLFLATIYLNETLTRVQLFGAMMALFGLSLIGANIDHEASLIGFILEIGAAAAWAVGNLVTKKMVQTNAFSLVAWGSLLATLPLLLLSTMIEGPKLMLSSLKHLSWISICCVAYTTYISTWFGYGVWNWLLTKYPMSSISPFALLVPVFGMVGSYFVFDETLESWKLYAAYCIILGLSINLFGSKILAYYKSRKIELYSE